MCHIFGGHRRGLVQAGLFQAAALVQTQLNADSVVFSVCFKRNF